MNLIFKDPKTFQRMHEGPLGQCIDSYAAEIRVRRRHRLRPELRNQRFLHYCDEIVTGRLL
jgi:hypothetical protein